MTYPNSEGSSFGGQDSDNPYGSQPYGGQPYGGGHPYGGQTYGAAQPYGAGQPYGAPGPAPDNYSVWAIIVTVLSVVSCSLIALVLGIIAITKSNKVNNLWAQGHTTEALESARQAKLLSMWGGGIMVAGWILGFVGYFMLFAVAASGY